MIPGGNILYPDLFAIHNKTQKIRAISYQKQEAFLISLKDQIVKHTFKTHGGLSYINGKSVSASAKKAYGIITQALSKPSLDGYNNAIKEVYDTFKNSRNETMSTKYFRFLSGGKKAL